MYITVSTGVGGGWILNGRPGMVQRDGRRNGHMVVDPAGPLCLCGKRGCVERLASGPYIPNRYESVYSTRLRGTSVRTLVGDNLEVAGQIVSQAATQGDELARVLERAGWALGWALVMWQT